MMSVAILVPESAEQAGVRPVASDITSGQVLPIGISFAKSLYDRVGDPVLLPKEASEAGVEMPTSGKAMSVVKESNPLASILGGPKKETPAGKEIPGRGQSEENSVASGLVRSSATAGAVVQPKKLLVDASANGAESSARVELPADDVIAALSIVAQAPTAAEIGTNFALPPGIPDEVVAAEPSAAEPGVRNFTVTPVKVKDVVASAKISKPNEDGDSSKSVHRAAGAIANGVEIKATPTVKSETDVTPVSVQPGVAHAVPVGEIGKRTSGAGVEIGTGAKTSMHDFADRVDAWVHTGDAQGAKVGDTDTLMPSTPVAEPKVIGKASEDPEKVAAALPALQEIESRMQSAPELSAGIVHAMFGRPEASVNVAAAAAGSLLGDSSAVRQVPGSIDHLPGLALEPRERDAVGPDATSMNGMPRMLTATPTALEVGIPNGTHGWLKVRAEMADGGGVNASVSTASPAGQEMLHRELPSLTAYLQQEKVSVNAVVIHAATSESSRGGGSGSDNNASMDGGSGQTPQRNSEGGEKLLRDGVMLTGRADESISFTEADQDGLIVPVMYDGGGTWLSVRA